MFTSPRKWSPPPKWGKKHKVTVRGAPRGQKACIQWGVALFPKGVVNDTAITTPVPCTIPFTLAWVDQSPVSVHSGNPQQGIHSTPVNTSHVTQGRIEYESTTSEGLVLWEASCVEVL
jgi:hypothetical protein